MIAPAGRVGADVKLRSPLREQKGTVDEPALDALHTVQAQGLDGVLFRTLYEMSPTLDPGELGEVSAEAAHLRLYLEVGIGKVNPYMTAELPEIRRLGDGSYLEGMQRMIAAAAAIGCTELWSATGNFKANLPGLFKNDRYRTDIDWGDQLAATAAFLRQLSPCLREHGVHLNLETHEEITSFELVRLVEEIGADVLGITFDSANVVVHGEHPAAAARRIAPYTRMTQLRDVVIVEHELGLNRYLAPCGDGVLDWSDLLSVLLAANPALNLTIEPAGPRQPPMLAPLDDQVWRAAHPDADAQETAELRALAAAYRDRTARRELPDESALARGGLYDRDSFLGRSAEQLRAALPANLQQLAATPAVAS